MSVLCSFSPDGGLFALVTQPVEKHTLRVYDPATARPVSEFPVAAARVSSLVWAALEEESAPTRKRRKRDPPATPADHVLLGTDRGSIVLFSPRSGVSATLSHPASSSSVLALAPDPSSPTRIWSSTADSSVALWDINSSTILASWKPDDRIPYTSLSLQPDQRLLAAHHHIRLLSQLSSPKPNQIATFTGHASPINLLRSTPHRFFSVANDDRFVYVWDANAASINQKPLASISLDSNVRTVALDNSDPSRHTLLALSSSGKLSFIPIPVELPSLNSSDKSSTIPSLIPRATLVATTKKSDASIVDVSSNGSGHSIRIVRLLKGTRPVFDLVRYVDTNGSYIQNIRLEDVSSSVTTDDAPQSIPTKRYSEPGNVDVRSGLDVSEGEELDSSAAQREIDGSLEVDVAELSLGQRLAAVADVGNEESDDEDDGPRRKTKNKSGRSDNSTVPANSLTRTLIQALHSGDSKLLEMCLAHSDPQLIRNTVRRLPAQLAIPLINACVERLGRGARAGNMKGRGGGASSQRGMGLVLWINVVLAVHTGHLMTIPDVVARLSGLHNTLTARLSLHESLLSLGGRLDTVLAQVEYRSSSMPAPLTGNTTKSKVARSAAVKHYVEGESDSEDDEEGRMEVEVEGGSDEEGSIEDVELGGESGSEEEDDSSMDSDEGHEFIDDEAEEEYTDEEEDDESE